MLTLRAYQEAARAAVYEHLRSRDDNPCVVIPTGGGKTPVIASICHDAVTLWQGRVLILAHVKELLEQAADKLRVVSPELEFGIYSAGLNRRDTGSGVIVAGIQSVHRRARELGAFDLIMIDEAHMLPPEGEGMYRQFLSNAQDENPNVRLIGFTATPFRMKDGPICTPDHFLTHVCYEVGVRELIRDGYLSPLTAKAGREQADTDALHVRAGEFVAGEVEALMDTEVLVESACTEIIETTRDRRAVLIFASGVQHGEHVTSVIERHGFECGFISGQSSTSERDATLKRFRDGGLKYLANVNVLTTGFDATHIDCVALLRPTLSPGLYYQMVGRGFRCHPGKQNCLVLDFGGNVLRHGPVDAIQISEAAETLGEAPAKMCPECRSLIAAGYSVCPECGFEFPPPDRQKHEAKASQTGVLSGEATDVRYDVLDVRYSVHLKRDADEGTPRTMRVEYRLGLDHWQSEWVCFEHTGYARWKAEQWWKRRSPDHVPETAQDAVDIANAGGVALAETITVCSVAGEKYDRIIAYELGELPEPVIHQPSFDDDEVPF